MADNRLIGMEVPVLFGGDWAPRTEYVTIDSIDESSGVSKGTTRNKTPVTFDRGQINVDVSPLNAVSTGQAVSNAAGVVSPEFAGNRAPSNPMSPVPVIGDKPDVPVIDEENTVLGQMKKSNELARKSMNMQLGLAGANFLISIMNADNAYNAVKGQARLNILQARNQAADALFRGRQAQLDRQSEGYLAGESALLEMAAQGQDVSGQAVGKVQSSLETVGIMNGMQEQINSMREALGFELEEIAYEYQIDQAGAKAQSDKFNAGLQLAASFLGAGL